jgi:hypothetical protein
LRSGLKLRSGSDLQQQIRRVEIIIARNPDQGEQAIAPRIGQRAPMRCGVDRSASVQTGQSEAIHSPDA